MLNLFKEPFEGFGVGQVKHTIPGVVVLKMFNPVLNF